MTCDDPYPCDFDMGILHGFAARFSQDALLVRVKHGEGGCRKRGDALLERSALDVAGIPPPSRSLVNFTRTAGLALTRRRESRSFDRWPPRRSPPGRPA